MNMPATESASVPREPLGRLFRRFLKFGLLAWGGPVAQIAMIRQDLVEEERWVSREHFNRVLALYQVLPGPEAHELCVYFGMLARGRLGGLLAGLAFMLPGFVLMFLLSWLYTTGLQSTLFQAFFLGIQPAVVALIIRAVHRIGAHVVTDVRLWALAIAAGVVQLAGVSFWVTLSLAGLAYLYGSSRVRTTVFVSAVVLVTVVLLAAQIMANFLEMAAPVAAPVFGGAAPLTQPSHGRLFVSGLRAGLLTFGGAYTVLPFLQHDAVVVGRWMANAEFLDGVALSGILPAPFIIFSTFVGYLGGGPVGALLLTVGIFLPAFGFTLIAHHQLQRLVDRAAVRTLLDGVTAGVVGLIGATSITLFRTGIRDEVQAAIFALALLVLYRWRAKAAVAVVMLAAGGIGALVFFLI